MRIKYNKSIEGKNAWLDANAMEDSPSLPLLLQLLQVQLVLPYGTGDQALLAMVAALYESDIRLLSTVEPGTVQVRYDATAAASLFADAPSGEVGVVWIEASKLDSPQSLSLGTPDATYYPLQLQGDSMSFKGLPYRHYMDDTMEVADKTVLYYCRCYFRASSTAEPLYDTVHSFSVQGLADNAYVYDRRYAADPFVLYPWLSDKFREEHGIGPIGYIAVEDTYTYRETADGADIIDGALATLKTVQGATVKTTNLLQLTPQTINGTNGGTVVVRGDGTLLMNVTYNTSTSFNFNNLGISVPYNGSVTFVVSSNTMLNHVRVQPYINGEGQSASNTVNQAITYVNTTDGPSYFEGFELYVDPGREITNAVLYPMLNEGSSALPYMPYFTGLKNAYFQGLKSTGRNLIPYPHSDGSSTTINGVTFTVNSDGSITANGTPTGFSYFIIANKLKLSGQFVLSGIPLSTNLSWYITVYNNQDVLIDSLAGKAGQNLQLNTSDFDGFSYCNLTLRRNSDNVPINNVKVFPMLNYGSSALPYEQYKSNELSLPAPIELAEWDTLDFVKNQKNVQSNTLTFDGTESGWYLPAQITPNTIHLMITVPATKDGNSLIATITKGTSSQNPGSNTGCYMMTGSTSAYFTVWFRQSAYPNVIDLVSAKAQLAAWNAEGNPLTICYQTANVTTTPLNATENRYTAYNGGSETVIQGTTDNSEYGAENTLTQEYYNLEVNDNE